MRMILRVLRVCDGPDGPKKALGKEVGSVGSKSSSLMIFKLINFRTSEVRALVLMWISTSELFPPLLFLHSFLYSRSFKDRPSHLAASISDLWITCFSLFSSFIFSRFESLADFLNAELAKKDTICK